MLRLGRYRVKIRRRLVPPPLALITIRVLAVLVALGIDGLILYFNGVNPVKAYNIIFKRVLLSWYGLAETIVKFIPLALCAYGLAIVFKAKIWNIGAEGQLLMGAIAATWVALFSPIPPGPYTIPLLYLAGFVAGLLWALLPAILKAKLNVNEVLTTFMLNMVAEKILEYLVYGPWKDPRGWGFPKTAPFPAEARLPTIPGTRIHYPTLILLFSIIILTYVLEKKTTIGYELKVVGDNPRAAEYSGIKIWKIILISMVLSGGLAGLAGVGEVAGIQGRLRPKISPGYGYTAIVVAWLGELHPIGVGVTSFLYSALLVGGDVLQVVFSIPVAVVNVFNGTILFTVVGLDLLAKYRIILERVD